MGEMAQKLQSIRTILRAIKTIVGISSSASLSSLSSELTTDKTNLVANLSDKGIEASMNESFSSLVSKVDTIDMNPTVSGTNLIFNTHSGATVEGSELQL